MADYQSGTPIEIQDTFTLDGIPTNPTTVTYSILGPDGTETIYTNADPEVTNPAVGEFLLSLSPPAFPGLYTYDVDATGAVVASRQGSFNVIANAVTGPALDWAVVGPCQPWASAQDVWNCCGQPMTTVGEGSDVTECPVDMTQYAVEASNILYELSGRLFAGACEKTVRPCTERFCGFQVLSRGYVVGPWSYWGWGWNGWGWWYDGSWGCGCRPLSKVKLSGYPVREIVEVKIDGVVLDPAEYRLDDRRYLVRLRDVGDPNTPQFWPSCQALDLADTEAGTFSVSYRYGQDVPLVGSAAAAQLGCELYRACSGQECALPSGTTRVSRQGVTIEKNAFISWAFTPARFARANRTPGWNTGMSLVDSFLQAYARAGVMRRPVFWAPGHRQYAQGVGQ